MLAASGAEHYLSVTSHVAKKISSCLHLRGAIKEVEMNSEHASHMSVVDYAFDSYNM